MGTITLSVQSSGKYWRLGLNKYDSQRLFSHLETVVFVLSSNVTIESKAACGTSKKKSYDFNKVELSKWIVDNNFHKYPKGRPIKLLFSLEESKKKKRLRFLAVNLIEDRTVIKFENEVSKLLKEKLQTNNLDIHTKLTMDEIILSEINPLDLLNHFNKNYKNY